VVTGEDRVQDPGMMHYSQTPRKAEMLRSSSFVSPKKLVNIGFRNVRTMFQARNLPHKQHVNISCTSGKKNATEMTAVINDVLTGANSRGQGPRSRNDALQPNPKES
jgi:hypothetical protein